MDAIFANVFLLIESLRLARPAVVWMPFGVVFLNLLEELLMFYTWSNVLLPNHFWEVSPALPVPCNIFQTDWVQSHCFSFFFCLIFFNGSWHETYKEENIVVVVVGGGGEVMMVVVLVVLLVVVGGAAAAKIYANC